MKTRTQSPTLKNKSGMPSKAKPMNESGARPGPKNESKKITMWIEWSDEDAAFIGFCPEFFPYGAVCHGHTEAKAIAKLAAIVRDELGEKTRRRMRLARVPK
jgi:hypothetical protein